MRRSSLLKSVIMISGAVILSGCESQIAQPDSQTDTPAGRPALAPPPTNCTGCPLSPTTISRTDGQTVPAVFTFAANAVGDYLLVVQDDGQATTGAQILLNNETVVSRTDLTGLKVFEIKKSVVLRASNQLTVLPLGAAGARVTVWILGGAKTIGQGGGVVRTPGSGATLTIPAGALTSPTVITIQPAASIPSPSRLVGGTDLDLQPSGLTFQVPVRLQVRVPTGSIPGGSRNESALRLFVDNAGAWDEVIGSTVNQTTHVVTASLAHFSTYGVLIGINGVRSLTTGTSHTCVVLTTGQGLCWGKNDHGQLGDGTNVGSNVPVLVQGGLTLASITAGADFTCALSTTGDASCWGWNTTGQLGNGTQTDANTPTAVLGGLQFAQLEAQEYSICGRTLANLAYCWGSNGELQLGAPSTGTCVFFQPDCSTTPIAVGGGYQFTSITSGLVVTCGLTTTGSSICWGANLFGQIDPAHSSAGTLPQAPPGGPYTRIFTGVSQTCGESGGAIQCWGFNFFGNMGNGSVTSGFTLPGPLVGGLTFASIDLGHADNIDAVSCGVTTAGAGYCWGGNGAGGLGTLASLTATCTAGAGGALVPCTGTPVPVARGLTYQLIQTGGEFACGLTTGGTQVFCWGLNANGQIGYSGPNAPVPVRVQ